MPEERKILVVEDDPNFSALLVKFLGRTGENPAITTAKTIEEGRRILKNTHIDVLFLDYILTDATGQSLIEFLRDSIEKTAVVIVSGYMNPELVEQQLKAKYSSPRTAKPFAISSARRATSRSAKRRKKLCSAPWRNPNAPAGPSRNSSRA